MERQQEHPEKKNNSTPNITPQLPPCVAQPLCKREKINNKTRKRMPLRLNLTRYLARITHESQNWPMHCMNNVEGRMGMIWRIGSTRSSE